MRLLLAVASTAFAYAQGTTPKAAAADYPVHGEAHGIPIGAEYMVHSFGNGEQMYVVEKYLVVEVALYFQKTAATAVEISKFELIINGKRPSLTPQAPASVAWNLAHPEWQVQQPPRVSAEAGAGPVILGTPGSRPQPIPGSPQSRLPAPPRAPDADPPGGIQRKTPLKPEELLIQTALPTEPGRGPICGFLYFPYNGKTSSIKSLELTWEGVSLKLR
jgi:hypothetical protein